MCGGVLAGNLYASVCSPISRFSSYKVHVCASLLLSRRKCSIVVESVQETPGGFITTLKATGLKGAVTKHRVVVSLVLRCTCFTTCLRDQQIQRCFAFIRTIRERPVSIAVIVSFERLKPFQAGCVRRASLQNIALLLGFLKVKLLQRG